MIPAASGDPAARSRSLSLVGGIVVRDIHVKYRRSWLGLLWTLLAPLSTAGLLLLVFTRFVRIPVEDYWAFLLSGFFVWHFVYECLAGSAGLWYAHAPLCRTVAFPKIAAALADLATRLVEFAVEMALVLVLLAVFHHGGVPAAWALLPLLVAIQAALALGLVLPLSILAIHFDDVRHALPPVLVALFYLSPVFYPTGVVPEGARGILRLNPVARLLDLYRDVLYRGRAPGVVELLVTTAVAGVVLLAGYRIFRRHADEIAEIV